MPDLYLNNVVTTLREGLLATDTVMKVKIGDGIKFTLPPGQYVYLTLRDRTTYEVVRFDALELADPPVPIVYGDDLVIVRGLDDTDARQFPPGTCVTVEWNLQQFEDSVHQIATMHEATVTGTPPIIVTNPSNLLWNVAIDNAAFRADTGEVDPVDPPADSTLPLYINTLTGSVWLWNGLTWQNLNPLDGTDLSGYALLDSPVFIGDPRGPTPAPGDNDTSLATTNFVTAADTALAAIIAGNLAAALAALNAAIAAAGVLQTVTATAPIASSGGANPNISHNTSGATPGTYDGATINDTGHVIGGTLVQSLASIVSGQSMTLANGIIIKWGSITVPVNFTGIEQGFTQTVNFPVPFPAAGILGTLSSFDEDVSASISSTSSGVVVTGTLSPSVGYISTWIAMGY